MLTQSLSMPYHPLAPATRTFTTKALLNPSLMPP